MSNLRSPNPSQLHTVPSTSQRLLLVCRDENRSTHPFSGCMRTTFGLYLCAHLGSHLLLRSRKQKAIFRLPASDGKVPRGNDSIPKSCHLEVYDYKHIIPPHRQEYCGELLAQPVSLYEMFINKIHVNSYTGQRLTESRSRGAPGLFWGESRRVSSCQACQPRSHLL